MAKSMRKRSYKKKRDTRKKKPIFSVSKMKRAHKKHITHHYLKGKHKSGRGVYGGSKRMKGGMVSSPASGPVGYSWNGGDISSWPGAKASQGLNTNGASMSNHFKVSPNGIVVGGVTTPEPSRGNHLSTSSMNGGKKHKKHKKNKQKTQKGGFFQELINLGRGVQYNVQGIGYGLVGKQQPISQNPFPTESQPIDNGAKIISTTPTNIKQVFVDANKTVAKI
jgi:hypothetical protein